MKRAYRRQAKRHHPDLNPGAEAIARMAAINHAHDLLSDPGRRAAWDAAHPLPPPAGPAASPAAAPRPRPGTAAPHAARGPATPSLDEALAFVLTFGKYRSRSLGFVAAVEPGYIAWMVRTLDNRPEVVRHARIVLAHLQAQGWRDTPRPPRAGRPRTTSWENPARPTPAGSAPRPAAAQPRRGPWETVAAHPGAVCFGLMAASAGAGVVGVPPESVSALVALLAFVVWPLWAIAQEHRRPSSGPRRPRLATLRAALGEAVVVTVLVAVGWALLQGVIEGPQPGDIVCELYDPRPGDCVMESVYGEDVP